jgi:tetratricopeptide (TPR) repeat protein
MMNTWKNWRARKLLKKCNDRYQAHDCKGAAALAARAAQVAAAPGIRNLAMVLRADYILHDGNTGEAIRLLQEAINAGAGTMSHVHKKLAKLLVQGRDFEGTITNCMKSLEVDGAAQDTFGLLGDANYQLGRKGLALHWFERTLAQNSSDPYAAGMIARLSAEPDPEFEADSEAEPLLGRITPGDGKVLIERQALEDGLPKGGVGDRGRVKEAMELLKLQDVVKAEALFQKVCTRCPEDYCFEAIQDNSVYVRCWDMAEFLIYANRVQRHPGGEVVWLPCVYPRAFYHMGQICAQRGDIASAFQYLEKGLELEPHSARFMCELGSNHARLGDFKRALERYEAASQNPLATIPDKVAALRGEADALAHLGRAQEAEAKLICARDIEKNAAA